MAKKGNNFLIFLLVVVLLIFAAPTAIRLLVPTDETPEDGNVIDTDMVLSAEIEWAQDSMSIDLLSGDIKLASKVDKIFVNVADVGVQELKYTQVLVGTANYDYATYTLEEQKGLLNTCFGSVDELKIDVYVQKDGFVYLVDTQTVRVKSCWTNPVAFYENELPLVMFNGQRIVAL